MANLFSPELAGAVSFVGSGALPVVPTSYAFRVDSPNQFGFTATVEPRLDEMSTATAILNPTLQATLRGTVTTVTCGPETISPLPTGVSITCPIANSAFDVGTAAFFYQPVFPETVGAQQIYVIAFTTVETTATSTTTYLATSPAETVTSYVQALETTTTTSTDTLTGFDPTITVTSCPTTTTTTTTPTTTTTTPTTDTTSTSKVTYGQDPVVTTPPTVEPYPTSSPGTGPTQTKKCRPNKQWSNLHRRSRRAVPGFAPPDFTFEPGSPASTQTVTSTITSPLLVSGTTTIVITTATFTSTITETSTVDERVPTTTTTCPATTVVSTTDVANSDVATTDIATTIVSTTV